MEFGDKRGFNVDNNPISQDVIHQYEKLGFSIGSHGGWIHNYFAFHVDSGDPKDLEKYLASEQGITGAGHRQTGHGILRPRRQPATMGHKMAGGPRLRRLLLHR